MAKVAIIGSGLIGRAWAIVFARAGWTVAMYDLSPCVLQQLNEMLRSDSALLVRHNLAENAEQIIRHISITQDLAEAVNGADFIQENGPENPYIKTEIFNQLDQLCDTEIPLASSTSSIVTSVFSKPLKGRHRCLVGHPVNPPHLVPLVEVSGASWTRDSVLQQAHQIYQDIGQVPVRLHKETDGFVLNRLQGALLAEALRLVAEGVISVEDLDKTVKDGLGLRWAFMGPFETIELNAPKGATDYFRRYGPVFAKMGAQPAGPDVFEPEVTQAVIKGWQTRLSSDKIKDRTQWRNERLAALYAHKKTVQ